MGVVDTGEINALATPGERFALIEQYANFHCLETGHHENRVMIPQHPIPASDNQRQRCRAWTEARALPQDKLAYTRIVIAVSINARELTVLFLW
jgi:hypothetical protein